jgi:lysophospholipase L1-like esterase
MKRKPLARLQRRSCHALTIAEERTERNQGPNVSRNIPLSLLAAGALAASLVAGPRADAASGPTRGEIDCQQAMARGLGRFTVALAECVMQCEAGARAGSNPVSDCLLDDNASFAGATAACVQEAEAEASAEIASGCGRACPRCYSGGDCEFEAEGRVAGQTIGAGFAASRLLYCDDSSSADGLTAGEAGCQDAAVESLATLIRVQSDCYARCKGQELSGSIPSGQCDPPAPADPATAACIARAEQHASTQIDEACVIPGELPECYARFGLNDAPSFVRSGEGGFAQSLPVTFCTPPDPTAVYSLALGDSLAVDVQNYPEQLLAKAQTQLPALQLVDIACAGATTGGMLGQGQNCICYGDICVVHHQTLLPYPHGTQLAEAQAFLLSHPGQVAFVTIDIGPNDIFRCPYPWDAACLAPMYTNLSAILAELRSTAGPETPIVGMNFYNPLLWTWLLGPAGEALAMQSNPVVLMVNDGFETTYGAAGVPVADVETAFATTDFTTTKDTVSYGELPLNVANICDWTRACDTSGGDFHAKPVGYGVIAQAFADVLGF